MQKVEIFFISERPPTATPNFSLQNSQTEPLPATAAKKHHKHPNRRTELPDSLILFFFWVMAVYS